jgi:hypothetical protein
MWRENYVDRMTEVDGLNKKETEQAVLFSDEENIEIWIPKSQLTERPEEGKTGTFIIAEWIAIKQGLV